MLEKSDSQVYFAWFDKDFNIAFLENDHKALVICVQLEVISSGLGAINPNLFLIIISYINHASAKISNGGLVNVLNGRSPNCIS